MQAVPRSAARSALRQVSSRSYSSSSSPYSQTVDNLRINADTKVLFQGFTGKQGTYVHSLSLRFGGSGYFLLPKQSRDFQIQTLTCCHA